MASTTPSVKVVKSFTFKGGLRQWSNRYYLTGGAPTDTTHWITLFDAITAAEKAVHGSHVSIVEALGYPAGTDVAAATKTYALAGTFSPPANSFKNPGEVAALVRWSTAARSIKNHPIYLFKYYHGVWSNTADPVDALLPNQRTALTTYATTWQGTGFSDGTTSHKLTSPQGHDATGLFVDEYVTHRDFPYTPST